LRPAISAGPKSLVPFGIEGFCAIVVKFSVKTCKYSKLFAVFKSVHGRILKNMRSAEIQPTAAPFKNH
jgi:hypothetical protein